MSDKGPVVIVGYGPGVGAALAEAFGREGHPLALIARDASKLRQAVEALQREGRTATSAVADAGDDGALSTALQTVTDTLGHAQILVYNAAHRRPGPVLETTPAALVDDFRLDVVGALVATQALSPAMIARGGGTLLFTGGGLALHPSPQAPSLSIGKAGLRALALMLAHELAPAGIRVGTVTIAGMVAPGTAFAPQRIAEAFMALHRGAPDPSTAEIVFRG
jgi:NAD(P)-dependent dehydrogenase (short-subunit alcohol dehydrogenase family)